jgi:cell division septation protein DedD
VQLVAAGSEAEARAHWAAFVQRLPDLAEGREPFILPFERPGQPTVWRLRAGGFASAAEAQAWCDRLRARGAACWVSG